MRLFACAGACLSWFALGLQLSLMLGAGSAPGILASLVAFLSFFTILTNLLVALVWTAVGVGRGDILRSASTQAATAVYIAIVGVCYHLLLRQTWNPHGAQLLADRLLHYAVPAGYVVYWLFYAPRASLRWTESVRWLGYPAVYLVYTLGRGALSGVYSYPFLDANTLGYGRFLLHAGGLAMLFFLTGLLVIAVGRLLPRGSRSWEPLGGR